MLHFLGADQNVFPEPDFRDIYFYK